MGRTFGAIMSALWIAWLIYWTVSAIRVKPAVWREPALSRALHWVLLLLAVLLLDAPGWFPPAFTQRIWPSSDMLTLAGTVLVALGLGFTVWARLHLGRNWSGSVTVKDEHSLVRSGPYRRVRHPIYTGLLLAIAGTALPIGEVRGPVALLLVLAAFLWKIRVEEQRMSETFPDYVGYRRESAALIPFVY